MPYFLSPHVLDPAWILSSALKKNEIYPSCDMGVVSCVGIIAPKMLDRFCSFSVISVSHQHYRLQRIWRIHFPRYPVQGHPLVV